MLIASRGRIGRILRTMDQRAGVFAPRGAGLYNAVAPTILRPLYRRVAEDVAMLRERVGGGETFAVVELGSGPGEVAIEIARTLPAADIVGVDLAPAMIERAVERIRAEGLDDRVHFIHADAAALPVPDESYDAAVSTLSLHHWAEPGTVFAEIGRVLRGGGVALVYDLRPFAYLGHELKALLEGTAFERTDVQRELVRLGRLPAVFVRIRLVKPLGA